MLPPRVATYTGAIDIAPPPGYEYREQPYSYVYSVTLNASQNLPYQNQPIQTFADFLLTSLVVNATHTPVYVLFYDGQNYAIGNKPVNTFNMMANVALGSLTGGSGNASDPFTLQKPILYPAGGKIIMDWIEGSGFSNPIQVTFTGLHRYLHHSQVPMSRSR